MILSLIFAKKAYFAHLACECIVHNSKPLFLQKNCVFCRNKDDLHSFLNINNCFSHIYAQKRFLFLCFNFHNIPLEEAYVNFNSNQNIWHIAYIKQFHNWAKSTVWPIPIPLTDHVFYAWPNVKEGRMVKSN